MKNPALRNICIIAHVDHGKTTLVDHLLKQSGTFGAREHVAERAMDSMDLERERGITIQAKNASMVYGTTRINIVDTPGHSDFGGEVERILGMVDGAVLLVDGAEGPLPQTRFVLQKALEKGHKIILVVNKVDRPECLGGDRVKTIIDQTFNLFLDLNATDAQADFPIIYACAREGWCTENWEEVDDLIAKKKPGTLKPLFERILSTIEAPDAQLEGGFQLMVSNLSWSDYVGQLAVGRILQGKVRVNDKIQRRGVNEAGAPVTEKVTVSRLYTYQGMKQVEATELMAGDIGVVAGAERVEIGDTFAGDDNVKTLERIQIDPPTLAMIFSVNTSPFSGREGEAIQSRKLRERLLKEVRHNVALKFQETELPDQFRVFGRGELQFGILIEQMRREGFEFMVGKPQVLIKHENGQKVEPLERATLDLPEAFAGDITRLFQGRKGILASYEESGTQSGGSNPGKRVRLEFDIPTRGLLGMRSRFMTGTRGEGLFSSRLVGYVPWKGSIIHRANGALVSDREGMVTEYALLGLEDRGILFVEPGVDVYEGMVVGEFNKDNDLNVNAVREKKLTNIRAASAEVLVTLRGVRKMPLERCIEWIDDDEWIEITPENVRLRKKVLKGNLRGIVRHGQGE
ncbi:MAG: translational GTPase TypA [Bdellovibrionales bacterium]|nr:translational GTPase TypA [Bdellovibrionales bacterium]